jgi:hypothetical protein
MRDVNVEAQGSGAICSQMEWGQRLGSCWYGLGGPAESKVFWRRFLEFVLEQHNITTARFVWRFASRALLIRRSLRATCICRTGACSNNKQHAVLALLVLQWQCIASATTDELNPPKVQLFVVCDAEPLLCVCMPCCSG